MEDNQPGVRGGLCTPVHELCMLIAHLQLPELRQVVEQGEGDDGGQVAPHWPGVGKLGGEKYDYVVEYIVNILLIPRNKIA